MGTTLLLYHKKKKKSLLAWSLHSRKETENKQEWTDEIRATKKTKLRVVIECDGQGKRDLVGWSRKGPLRRDT